MGKYGLLENYKMLGAGVVEFALDDYKGTVKSLMTYYAKLDKALESRERPKKHHLRVGDICSDIYRRIQNLNEIERFLTGNWVEHLTTLDANYLFKELKKRLREKGYRIDIMSLQVTTDDNGITVFAKKKEGSYGSFMTYSVGVSSKNKDGGWLNSYIQCRFKKDVVDVPNKTRIKINRAFFNVYKSGDKTYPYLMITDFDIIKGSAADDANNFIKIPEGPDDDAPFL